MASSNDGYYNAQYNAQYNSHVHDGSNYASPPPYHQQQPGTGRPPNPYTYGAAARTLPPRHPRVLFLISITRPWAIVTPFIALVMDIWWFSTGRLCGGYDATSDCYLVLWYSMPVVRILQYQRLRWMNR